MAQSNIWLKPKPTHIDEYFDDFLDYIKKPAESADTLYTESIRLLKERVAILVDERTEKPLYRQEKDLKVLEFNIRLCGAWLLAVNNATASQRKQVLLTMINNMVYMSVYNTERALLQSSYAYKSVLGFINKALKLATHNMPSTLTFAWDDIVNFSLDQFAYKFIKMQPAEPINGYYEDHGLMITNGDTITLANYSKQEYDKDILHNKFSNTALLPEYGFTVSNNKKLQIKESQIDNISEIEDFVSDMVDCIEKTNAVTKTKTLKTYVDGAYVPVEVTSVASKKIMLKTIDPNYNTVEGELVFDKNMKLFSKVYPAEVWAKVIKVGDRFNVNVNTCDNTFSITELFIKYFNENVHIGDTFDAHYHKIYGAWRNLTEFWTNEGFMVFVNITEAQEELLYKYNCYASNCYASIEITQYGVDQFEGCLYGNIINYEVENDDSTSYQTREDRIEEFLEEHSEISVEKVQQSTQYECFDTAFIDELAITLNLLQSREVNPLLRYRILSVMQIMFAISDDEKGGKYCKYIAKYLKTLITFAQADQDEGNIIKTINAPEDLKDEESVMYGADILNILSCFAKDYDGTSAILDPYIDNENEILSKTASLVQSYNRLCGLLENKTLRGIKKRILEQLSVVVDGDSNLELSNELEGIYGDEDDMKEFKTSFFVAPTNAHEQRQFHNIFRGICAMMNNRGGVMYLGVNDKGIPVGVQSDLKILKQNYNRPETLDAYMIYISKMGEEWFGEKYWKYVSLKPISEHNVVSIIIEPYPYDIVYLKDETTYLRKNNASAPINDPDTIDDIRRRRQENMRKSDDKIIVLQDAIQKKHKVRLLGYSSSNSGTIKNRLVEPFNIDSNEYIVCYEDASKQTKVFRISRAEKIVMTDNKWENEDRHTNLNIDAFHMSGTEKIEINIQLKLDAKNSIEEMYPNISKCITKKDNSTWILKTFTYNLHPLVLFYICHAKSISIIKADGLKEAVAQYVKENLNI